jgi:hypothetical protein
MCGVDRSILILAVVLGVVGIVMGLNSDDVRLNRTYDILDPFERPGACCVGDDGSCEEFTIFDCNWGIGGTYVGGSCQLSTCRTCEQCREEKVNCLDNCRVNHEPGSDEYWACWDLCIATWQDQCERRIPGCTA